MTGTFTKRVIFPYVIPPQNMTLPPVYGTTSLLKVSHWIVPLSLRPTKGEANFDEHGLIPTSMFCIYVIA